MPISFTSVIFKEDLDMFSTKSVEPLRFDFDLLICDTAMRERISFRLESLNANETAHKNWFFVDRDPDSVLRGVLCYVKMDQKIYIWNASIYRFHLATENAFLLLRTHTHARNHENIRARAKYEIFLHYSIGFKVGVRLFCFFFSFIILFSIVRTIYSVLLLQLCASTKIKLCPWILLCVCLWLYTYTIKE